MPENQSLPEQTEATAAAEALQTAAPLQPTDAQLPAFEAPPTESLKPRTIAPLWHTLILVVGILAYSAWGAIRATPNPLTPSPTGSAATASHAAGINMVRIIRYALTGAVELAIVAWVAFGLRLRRIPFRSLFGSWPRGLNNLVLEAGVAVLFWICSMTILASVALTWVFVEKQIEQHHHPSQTQSAPSPSSGASHGEAPSKGKTQPAKPAEQTVDEKQSDLIRELSDLAPANGVEIAAWGLLCLIVGFSEELVFRGYLQAQSIALLRKVPVGVVLAAIVFGAAHGYQGVRGIVLISVYGALFGCIALLRRNLFPGMLAHSWHDFAVGLALSLIRASGMLEHLSKPH